MAWYSRLDLFGMVARNRIATGFTFMKNIYLLIFTTLCVFTLAYGDVDFQSRLVEAALERTKESITYDGSYFSIPYPNGDVPPNIGVCTDVIIRSYRKVGFDLQRLVHEDIADNFSKYPSKRIWG